MASDHVEPVIVVTRDPDREDQISLYGLPEETRVIYLDLGSSFDIGRLGAGDDEDIRMWLETKFLQLDGLPSDHAARDEILEVVDRVRRRFDIDSGRADPHGGPKSLTLTQVTNDDRAAWANRALQLFADRTGLVLPRDTYEAASDLVADLQHWWDRHGVEDATWEDVIAAASNHYNFEAQPDNEPDGRG